MGYRLYSIDQDAFTRLTSAPTQSQALALADALLEDMDPESEETVPDPLTSIWPLDRLALASAIRRRLAAPDWYSDLTLEDAAVWERVFLGIDEVGDDIGVEVRPENDGYLDWVAAGMAAEHGASMMAESSFGHGGFRYSGKPEQADPIYGIYLPEQTRQLLAELEAVAGDFLGLTDGEGSVRDQFFEGLLKPVRRIVSERRILYVQVDT